MGLKHGSEVRKISSEIVSLPRQPIRTIKYAYTEVAGGYRFGKTGKIYPTKAQAEAQARAIYASGYREKEKPTKK